VMRIAYPLYSGFNFFHSHLSVRCGNGDEFTAEESFRRGRLVDVNMRKSGTKDRVVRARERVKSQYVGPGSVVNQVYRRVIAKVFFKSAYGGSGIPVIAIGGFVISIGAQKRLHDSWVNAGIVVAGKGFLSHLYRTCPATNVRKIKILIFETVHSLIRPEGVGGGAGRERFDLLPHYKIDP